MLLLIVVVCCVEYRGDTTLASKQARQQWENAFVNTYVAPVLNVR